MFHYRLVQVDVFTLHVTLRIYITLNTMRVTSVKVVEGLGIGALGYKLHFKSTLLGD